MISPGMERDTCRKKVSIFQNALGSYWKCRPESVGSLSASFFFPTQLSQNHDQLFREVFYSDLSALQDSKSGSEYHVAQNFSQ